MQRFRHGRAWHDREPVSSLASESLQCLEPSAHAQCCKGAGKGPDTWRHAARSPPCCHSLEVLVSRAGVSALRALLRRLLRPRRRRRPLPPVARPARLVCCLACRCGRGASVKPVFVHGQALLGARDGQLHCVLCAVDLRAGGVEMAGPGVDQQEMPVPDAGTPRQRAKLLLRCRRV